MGMQILLLDAIEKNCGSLQVFGDSMLVVNWSKGIQRYHNLILLFLSPHVIGCVDLQLY